jgi:DNA-binding transcriptional LysR family regulator
MKFDVSLSERIVDLVEEGFDLGVRIGQVGSQNLVARKLGQTRLVACAAPAYLARRGTPRSPADLASHNCFVYAHAATPGIWRFLDPAGREQVVRVAGSLVCNSGDLLMAAALAGTGIVYEPSIIVGPALAEGRLVRILPGYQSPPSDIWAVYPTRRHLSAKVRSFVDFLAARFDGRTDWGGAN